MSRGKPRSGPNDLVGVLNVRKERGWTSHDVVARLRRLSGQRRIGHAGTLDPLAEGVLPVLLGRATRLADLAGEGRKQYHAEVQLGSSTNTDDAEGEVMQSAAVPELDEARIQAALDGFRGEIQQVPPAYSALMVDGQRAYALARRGQQIDLAPRTITVYELTLVGFTADCLELDITCSRGTYVRSLARDLAVALGTVGHLRSLVRTRVGSFELADALTLAEIEARGVQTCLLPADRALPDAPRLTADDNQLRDLQLGRPISPGSAAGFPFMVRQAHQEREGDATADGEQAQQAVEGTLVRVYDQAGTMRYVAVVREGRLWPRIPLYAVEGS